MLKSGETIVDELAVANAHSAGARPFARADYIRKFETLADGIASADEQRRFLDLVQRLPDLGPEDLGGLNVAVDPADLVNAERDERGIF